MNWIIYENGEEINQIYADENFVKSYCENHGYTYERRVDPEPEPEVPEPTADEVLNTLLGVSNDEQITAG